MKNLLTAFFLLLIIHGTARAALLFEGVVSSTSVAFAITTTHTNDVIIAAGNQTSSSASITGVSDTAGLTWIHRSHKSDATTNTSFDEWYAISSGTLTADTVTLTVSGSTGRYYLFGVNGANLTTPFDTNASLPGYSANTSISTLSVSSVTTNCSTDAVYAFIRDTTGTLGTITYPDVMTALSATTAGALGGEITASLLSGTNLTYSWTGGAATALMFADAIQAASCGGVAAVPFSYGFVY